jgi:uncharacterized protein (TIGR03067 family)
MRVLGFGSRVRAGIMVRPAVCYLGGCLVVAAVALAGPSDTAEPGLQGDWTTKSFLRNGAPLPKEKQFPDRLMTIKGDTFSERRAGKVAVRGTLKVDATKAPKWIDATFLEGGPGLNETVLGIYKLDGDTLTVCCGVAGDPRPSAFESKAGTGLRLIVYERHKP